MARLHWLALVALAAAASAGACGGDSGTPARTARPTGSGGAASALGGPAGQMNSGACEDGLEAECVVYYGSYQNVLSCFHGFQLCHCSAWGPCVEKTELYNVGGTCGGGAAGSAGEGGNAGSAGVAGAN